MHGRTTALSEPWTDIRRQQQRHRPQSRERAWRDCKRSPRPSAGSGKQKAVAGVNFFLNCAALTLGILSKAMVLRTQNFMAKLFDLPRYIAVEGPIRVGKSTLATILADRLNAQRVTDPEQSSFLASFYEGTAGAAFQTQFTFLIRRFEQLQALDLGGLSQKVIVSDFIFEKD